MKTLTKILKGALLMGLLAVLLGCGKPTDSINPVKPFDSNRYLGKWYELARYDHSFEKGLVAVSAEYARRPDGRISVLNRGYNPARDKWNEANGVAKFAGASDVGYLKVSFFGPFYGDYKIAALDPDYRWAIIASSTYEYFWILHREPIIPDADYEALVEKAVKFGFERSRMIKVDQSKNAKK
jgi:apolipoprotein D and lipocalin family protein